MRVYFAHPCFNEDQERFKEGFLLKFQDCLERVSPGKPVTIEDPFCYTPNIEGNIETKIKLSKGVMSTCLDLLEECNVVVALVDGNDTGVAFEVGYAHRLNIPVVLISESTCNTANAMLIGSAKSRLDNILEDHQMEKLVRMLEWYSISKEK